MSFADEGFGRIISAFSAMVFAVLDAFLGRLATVALSILQMLFDWGTSNMVYTVLIVIMGALLMFASGYRVNIPSLKKPRTPSRQGKLKLPKSTYKESIGTKSKKVQGIPKPSKKKTIAGYEFGKD